MTSAWKRTIWRRIDGARPAVRVRGACRTGRDTGAADASPPTAVQAAPAAVIKAQASDDPLRRPLCHGVAAPAGRVACHWCLARSSDGIAVIVVHVHCAHLRGVIFTAV